MKEEIIKLRREGKSYKEICEILGCSKGTVSYHCKDIPDLFTDVEDKILKLRKEGKTHKEILNLLNGEVTKVRIQQVCRNNDLQDLSKLSEEKINEIVTLYNEVRNFKKVARIAGVTYDTVRKYITLHDRKLPEEQLKKNKSKGVITWRQKVKLLLIEYKGGKCCKCGYDKCVRALEFHHLDPKEKDFGIGGKSYSFEKMKAEVDKCILVCSNCHNEIHHELDHNKDSAELVHI